MLAGLAVAYFGAGLAGVLISGDYRSGLLSLPPTGVALAAVLLIGYRTWPALFAGAFLCALVVLETRFPNSYALTAASLGIALGSTLEAMAAGWLVRRFAGGRDAFRQSQTILPFVALTAAASLVVGGTIGATVLRLSALPSPDVDFGNLWFTWWMGDLAGAIVITPLILAWTSRGWPVVPFKRSLEYGALLMLVLLLCLLVFGGWFTSYSHAVPMTFLLIPFLLWAAFRFGLRGTALTAFVVAVVATFETVHGAGPLALGNRDASLLLLHSFLAVITVISLILAADVGQSQRMEAELRISEQHYRELFEQNPQPMWVYDYDTLRFLAVNSAAIRTYGYSRDEFLQMTVRDIRPPEDLPSLLERVSRARAGQEVSPQARHRRKDGSLIEVEVTRHNLAFNGHPAAVILSQDVTDRNRAEKRARVFSELGRCLSGASTPRQAAEAIAETADKLFGWDTFTLDLLAPDGERTETIYCVDTIAGRRQAIPVEPAIPGPLAVRVLEEGPQLILRPSPARFGGETTPVGDSERPSASLMYVPVHRDGIAGGIISLQSYRPNAYTQSHLDLLQRLAEHCSVALQRMRAEKALRESNERLRLALAASRMGTWSIELQPELRVFLSPELEAICGLAPGEFAGTREALLTLVHPDDHAVLKEAGTRAVHETGDYEIELRFLRRGRETGWLLARGRAYGETHQKPARLAGVAIDITARRLAEEEVRRLNSDLEWRVVERTAQLEAINKELEAFSYSVSHDLRAPLRSIRGFSEVLLERYAGQLDKRGQEFLLRACQSSQHMDRLIEDLLKLSRVGRSELQHHRVNLSALAEAIAAELQQNHPDRCVRFQIAGGLQATGDERLLRIMLENLLRNAWKFTARQPEPVIEFGFTQRPRAAFFVRDNGAGFDMTYAPKLFGVFQRLHSPSEFSGTGIGLATVRRIIARHGGRTWAEGAVNRGATFYFTLEHDEWS